MPSSPVNRALLLILAVAGGCTPGGYRGTFGTPDGGGAPDLSISLPDVDLAMPWAGPCDDVQHPCKQGERCYMDQCVQDNGTCQADGDCQNDSYCDCLGGGGGDAGPCMGGICVPWGLGPKGSFDPDCQTPGFSATQFVAPKLKCKWAPNQQSGTLVTPIVADLDGDKKPEIIFESYPTGFTALHGADCSVYFTKSFSFATQNQSQLAVADLDGDKIPEIIGVDSGDKVVVFDNKGNVLATSPTKFSYTGAPQDWGGPAIADVDNKAPPEIIVAGQVSRYVKGQGITVLWTQSPKVPEFGPLSIVADLDGDKKPEVIAGLTIYDGLTGADKTPPALKQLGGAGAFPATGDFNKDKKPDIVLIQAAQGQEQVSVFDYANNKFLFGPYTIPQGWGGPPTVADFDGDGEPEFGSAGPDFYYVFDLECAKQQKPAKCDQGTNYGVLWKKATQDHSSGGTASSVFDFNGDGAAEVVYRDECWLRVYNGPNGKTVFAANVTSATALELPVIADVDNDNHADIVVTSDAYVGQLCPAKPEVETNTPWTGNTYGIFVFQDPMNRWMPSRSVWNQHAYHITNINDDLSVPTVESDNWLTFNNYRQNVQGGGGKPQSTPDFTGGVATGIDPGQADCMVSWTLRANLCNRGTLPMNPGVFGTFYSTDPDKPNPQKICTTQTAGPLPPGVCETVQCDWKNPPMVPTDIWFKAGDDGTGGKPAQNECKPTNNTLFLPQAVCQKIG